MGFAQGLHGELGITELDEDIRNCGIGTMISLLRFIDEDLTTNGGFNIQNRGPQWDSNPELKERARKNCSIIMFVNNSAKKQIQSKSYINAAILANYITLYSFRCPTKVIFFGYPRDGFETDLRVAKSQFTSEETARQFINEKGAFWYFCK